jgi:hypothetical protein
MPNVCLACYGRSRDVSLLTHIYARFESPSSHFIEKPQTVNIAHTSTTMPPKSSNVKKGKKQHAKKKPAQPAAKTRGRAAKGAPPAKIASPHRGSSPPGTPVRTGQWQTEDSPTSPTPRGLSPLHLGHLLATFLTNFKHIDTKKLFAN